MSEHSSVWPGSCRPGPGKSAYFFQWMTKTSSLGKRVGTHTCSPDSYMAHPHPLWLHPLSWQEGTTMWGHTGQTYPISSALLVGGSGTKGRRSSGAALPEEDHVPLPALVSLLTVSIHPTPRACCPLHAGVKHFSS